MRQQPDSLEKAGQSLKSPALGARFDGMPGPLGDAGQIRVVDRVFGRLVHPPDAATGGNLFRIGIVANGAISAARLFAITKRRGSAAATRLSGNVRQFTWLLRHHRRTR
jgi:hypothetical protein